MMWVLFLSPNMSNSSRGSLPKTSTSRCWAARYTIESTGSFPHRVLLEEFGAAAGRGSAPMLPRTRGRPPMSPNEEWLDPWVAVGDQRRALEKELRREVSRKHALHGRQALAIGRRVDRDDVLFELEGGDERYAVVHLTWNREKSATWPYTVFFGSLAEWRDECMVLDHEEYFFDEE